MFTGYHNRKTGILALCSLLELPFAELPPYMQQAWPHLYDMALHLFSRYEYAEQLWLEEEDDEDEDDEEEEEDGDEEDDGEEDEIDDDADYDDDEGTDLADLETLRMLGEAAEDDEVDGGRRCRRVCRAHSRLATVLFCFHSLAATNVTWGVFCDARKTYALLPITSPLVSIEVSCVCVCMCVHVHAYPCACVSMCVGVWVCVCGCVCEACACSRSPTVLTLRRCWPFRAC